VRPRRRQLRNGIVFHQAEVAWVELNVELETDDDPHITAKIALAHLNEFPDYYTRLERLERMEEEAKQD